MAISQDGLENPYSIRSLSLYWRIRYLCDLVVGVLVFLRQFSRQLVRLPRHLLLMAMQKPFEQALLTQPVVTFRPIKMSEDCHKLVITHQKTKSTPEIFSQPGYYPPAEQVCGIVAASRLVELNDVYLTNLGRAFDQEGRALNECWHRPVFLRKHWIKHRLQGVAAYRGKVPDGILEFESVLMLHQQNSHFYGHFLIEVLSRLTLAKRIGLTESHHVYLEVAHESHRQALELMGIDMNRLVLATDQPVIKARKATVPVHTHFKGWVEPELLKETVNLVRERVSPSNGDKLPRRIHVSRENMGVKNIINDAQVDQVLDRYGFVKVYPEQMTFADQVQLFSQAEFVVGILGSAMYNAIFCPPGAVIIDFAPACIDNRLHDVLHPLGLVHATVQMPVGSMRKYKRTRDIRVVLGDLERTLKAHRLH